MRVRAIRSFVWHGPRDVDVGDILDVSDREAHLLVAGYGSCVPDDGEELPLPPVAMTVADPAPRRRR
jgi:hypothetical protein